MARGDVVTDGTDGLAASGFMDVQPTSGDEHMVRAIGFQRWTGTAPNSHPDAVVSLADGSSIQDASITKSAENAWYYCFPFLTENAFFTRIQNNSGDTSDVSYSAVQTK